MLNPKAALPKASMMAFVVALVAAAACLLVVLATAGTRPAEAQPRTEGPHSPLKYVMADSTSDNKRSGTYKAVAQCPASYQAISGGFDLHLKSKPSTWTLYASRPATAEEAISQTAWVVEAAKSESRSGYVPFTAYAVCAHESVVPSGADNLYHTSSEATISANSAAELTPPCTDTHIAIGGGFAYVGSSPELIRLTRSQPNPGGQYRSWIVRLSNFDINVPRKSPQKVRAYSVCIRKDLVKDLQFFQHTESSKDVINSNTPRCPGGTVPLSGGGGTGDNFSDDIRWSHIRPGGGSEATPPSVWSAGAVDHRIFPLSKIPVAAHVLCGTLGDQQPPGGGGGEEPPPTQPMLTKEACKNGGYAALGYENQGRCISAANKEAGK